MMGPKVSETPIDVSRAGGRAPHPAFQYRGVHGTTGATVSWRPLATGGHPGDALRDVSSAVYLIGSRRSGNGKRAPRVRWWHVRRLSVPPARVDAKLQGLRESTVARPCARHADTASCCGSRGSLVLTRRGGVFVL